MNDCPLISVIIPTKNRRELLRQTLASVAAQTYERWEAVVVDDGSTDGTEEMVRHLGVSDHRIRYVPRQKPPANGSACRNAGVSAANGEFIVFLDSDDLLAPTCLQGRIEVMKDNPRADFAVFMTRVFHALPGDSNRLWNTFTAEDDLDRFLRRDQPWHTSGPIWRKSGLAKVGRWDERALSAQDWEFHIRALAARLNYVKISVPDSYWRTTSGDSLTSRWANHRFICNRVSVYKRVIAVLRSQGALTNRRQQLFAALIHRQAFEFDLPRRLGMVIWAAGRRTGIVRTYQYLPILFCEGAAWLMRKAHSRIARVLFPEARLPRSHLSASVEQLPLSQESTDSGVHTPEGLPAPSIPTR